MKLYSILSGFNLIKALLSIWKGKIELSLVILSGFFDEFWFFLSIYRVIIIKDLIWNFYEKKTTGPKAMKLENPVIEITKFYILHKMFQMSPLGDNKSLSNASTS